MKKLSLALAVTSALGASAANAAIVSEYANSVVVPWVTFDSTDVTTAVNITSCAAGRVYWSFFNTASRHIRDKQFDVTANDMVNFVWSDPNFGGGLQGIDGYMVLTLDTDGDARLGPGDSTCLAGNAFFVDVPANDVSYIPVVPANLDWDDFATDANGFAIDNLFAPTETYPLNLWAGAQSGDVIHMRYFADAGGVHGSGNDSIVYIWSAPDIVGDYTVQVYDDNQTRLSAQLFLANPELNFFSVEPDNAAEAAAAGFSGYIFGGIPYSDGFIEWVIPAYDDGNGILSWTIADSPVFQATQTIMNPFLRPRNEAAGQFGVLERYNPDGLMMMAPAPAPAR